VRSAITDVDGRPLPGLKPFLMGYFGGDIGGETDEKGQVVFGPLPPDVKMIPNQPKSVSCLTVAPGWAEGFGMKLEPGQTRELPVLRVAPEGRRVEGIVVTDDGQPVERARVVCFRGVANALTDDHGRFTLTRLPIRHDSYSHFAGGKELQTWIVASHPARPLYAARTVDPDSGETVQVVLRPMASVRGRVVDGDGRPLRGIEVRGWGYVQDGRASPQWQVWGIAGIPEPESATTDGDVRFEIDRLISGAPYAAWRTDIPFYTQFKLGGGEAAFIADADETVDVGDIGPKE
jgi:hypothetical protein